MNLRILKKLSKKAVPLLAHFGVDQRDLFLARKADNHTGLLIQDRTCWDRCRSVHDEVWGGEIKRPARDGNGWVCMRPPSHPLKGTPMVGRMEGYEEPEWDERTALEELMNLILYADKPASMTNAEWALAQRITGVTPITDEQIDEMLADMDSAAEHDFDLCEGEG